MGVLISSFDPSARRDALDIKLTIQKKNEKLILIHNLIYYIKNRFEKLPYEVSLTPLETFYIFSNLSVTGILMNLKVLRTAKLDFPMKIFYHDYKLNEFAKQEAKRFTQSSITNAFEYPLSYLNYI